MKSKQHLFTIFIVLLALAISATAQAAPPVAICQDVTVQAGPDCQADASIDNGSYDPDGDPITIDQFPPGPYPLGETVVELTVTDSYGNEDSCQATVTVVDTTPPTIICPGDVTVEQESHDGTVVPLQATATDNCDPDPDITSDELAIYPLGVTTVTFTATDASGNTASCSMTVTVVVLTVDIDIKPGSCPNPFNGKNKGVIPVAIVGSADFDVATVDPASITLAGVSPLTWAYDDTTQPVEDPDCYNCFDAEDPANFNCDLDGDGTDDAYCGDGDLDLILKFDTRELAAAVAGPGRDECFEVVLSGETIDGVLIEGSDFMIMKTKNK